MRAEHEDPIVSEQPKTWRWRGDNAAPLARVRTAERAQQAERHRCAVLGEVLE
jgi:hypothetical protein